VAANHDPDQLGEICMLMREYEASLLVSCDPEEQRRLRRILTELRACVVNMENR